MDGWRLLERTSYERMIYNLMKKRGWTWDREKNQWCPPQKRRKKR